MIKRLTVYPYIEPKYSEFINPTACFCIEDFKLYAFSTVGESVEKEVSRLFDMGKYTDALELNNYADIYLMELDRKLCGYIEASCSEKFVKRIPHENAEPCIIGEIRKRLPLFEYNQSYAVSPQKSLLFMAERGEGGLVHSCNKCMNFENCSYRSK